MSDYIPFPDKKYEVIYADPPWTYKNYAYAKTKTGTTAKRGVRKEYPTMTVEEIKALPVGDIAADNCALFVWVTFPLLQEGLATIAAWGFEYKTLAFNWVKRNKKSPSWFWGMGNFTRCLRYDTQIYLYDLKDEGVLLESIEYLKDKQTNDYLIWSGKSWEEIENFWYRFLIV